MSIIDPPAAEIRCHHHKHGWTFEHRPNLGTFGKISGKLAKQRKFLENWKTKKNSGKLENQGESWSLEFFLLSFWIERPFRHDHLFFFHTDPADEDQTAELCIFCILFFPTILLISAPWMVLWKIVDERKPKNGPKQGHPSCRVKHPLEMVQSYIEAKV